MFSTTKAETDMEFKDRKRYFNLCNPDEALLPDDARNVDLDRLGGEASLVRGTNWVDRLASQIELSDQPVCQLFTGLPGSGKSTELLRLSARLGREDGANLLTVLIAAEEVLDLTSPIDVPDVLMVILSETERALLTAEGKDPDRALREGYLARLWHWLTETEVWVPKAEAGIGGAKLVLEMKTNPSLRQNIREQLAKKMPAFLDRIREDMGQLNERAQKMGRAGLVVLLDSLEKLRGISTNWQEVLSSAERLFTGGAPFLQIPVHVLYTVPVALILRLAVPVEFLPMIKLHERAGSDKVFAPGYEAARSLVFRRLPEEHLRELLGPSRMEGHLHEMIRWSGGYPREIVWLLRRMVQHGSVSETLFRHLLDEAGDTYRRIVPESALPWLARVALDHELKIEGDDHHPAADRMLQNNIVLRYRNQSEWFEVHPAVRESRALKEAVQSLAEERARKGT